MTMMNVFAIFGLSAFLSLTSSVVFAKFCAWPWLRGRKLYTALLVLVAPHMFLRFIGLSLLVPGVVSPSLPAAFALPAAYGDVVAGLLAIVATIALSRRASWSIAAVWVFNLWGAADLLLALFQGPRLIADAGMLGAAFYLPTAIVPPLLVSHALVFLLLLRRADSTEAEPAGFPAHPAGPRSIA